MSVHELYAYLRFPDPDAAIAFYIAAFGATEDFRLTDPEGRIGHAELKLGPATLMVSSEYPEMGIIAPSPANPAAITLHLHVDDADATIDSAVTLGATLLRPPADHFYGERSGTIRDPFGYDWLIGHHIEDVTTDEMQRRYEDMSAA